MDRMIRPCHHEMAWRVWGGWVAEQPQWHASCAVSYVRACSGREQTRVCVDAGIKFYKCLIVVARVFIY